jgi:hypothetical protein
MKTEKKEIKTVFEWLNEITLHKTPLEKISENSWNSWNSWLVNKYLSMDIRYIELVNYIQTIPYDNKQQLYQIYREMIPKAKTFFKYLKSNTKKKNHEVLEYIATYYQCSLGEAEEYLDILREVGARRVLYDMGVEDKKIEKLLK